MSGTQVTVRTIASMIIAMPNSATPCARARSDGTRSCAFGRARPAPRGVVPCWRQSTPRTLCTELRRHAAEDRGFPGQSPVPVHRESESTFALGSHE